MTQLRPNPPAPLTPGTLPDQQGNDADQTEDPAIAAAAAAGLVTVPATNPGPGTISAPLMAPGAQPRPGPAAPGVGAPTNPWNAPVGTAQPSLAPPPTTLQPPPLSRPRPPQADR
jgi:hypothetical protein